MTKEEFAGRVRDLIIQFKHDNKPKFKAGDMVYVDCSDDLWEVYGEPDVTVDGDYEYS